MELFFELLLTAVASLLVAFLLAKLFGANEIQLEPSDRLAGSAAVIAEETVEEERIIEVDEVKAKGALVDVAEPMAAEEWVQVEKSPPTVAVGETECLAEEEGVPTRLPRELFLGTALKDRDEEGEVGKKQCDLTAAAAAATETAVEAKLRDLDAKASSREVLGVELDKERAHQHDSSAVVSPSEVLETGLQNQEVQATEAVEEVKHDNLFVGAAAPADALDVVLEEETTQASEASPHELASDTVPGEVLGVAFEKREDQVIEVNQKDFGSVIAQRGILDVALAEKEKLEENPIEGVGDVCVEVRSNDEVECEGCNVDQQEELVPNEELVPRKAADLDVSQEVSSSEELSVQLPENEVALVGMPEDKGRAYIEFEEWEGIERSEVEKRFGAAAAFAASDAGAAALSKLDSDLQLQLQGLLKVAIDGPCYDSTQPLTLRPSSRAKWIAWQKLGNMHPEVAMEKYMNLLSEIIPGWMGDKTLGTNEHEADGDSESEGPILTMTTPSDKHINQGNEDSTTMDEGPLTGHFNPGQSPNVAAE